MTNAPLTSQIEAALDDLESHEGGMRFQSLAVVLARQRWPELVAAERKNDLGLDAFVTRAQASDGVGRGLACSITPSYSKIAGDATNVTKYFGEQIQHLVFATSGKVTTPKKIDWANKIREEFGFELEVISREDIVTSLTDPRNVALCRTYLGLDLRIEPSVADLIDKIREAARDEVGNWARRIAGRALIELDGIGLDPQGADSDRVWALNDIGTALRDSHRLVLEAPAGRGKTTTLIQLAQGPLGERGTVFFIDLPSWVKHGGGILSFIAGMPEFERRGLTSQRLAQTEAAEQFYFLLNGWNEITDSRTTDAAQMMKDLERQFPSAGILVATRAHYVSPPLPGATRIRLRRIAGRARALYVRQRLAEGARELLSAIEADSALDELTRVPFVLSEITSVVDAGEPIPRTRVAVMDAVIRLQERSPEHEAALRSAPLGGMSAAFLEALAARMIKAGAITLSDAEARVAVHEVSGALAIDGQLLPRPAPVDVLNALCAHHLLERFEYPEIAYRFEHQLFEEYYASRGLQRRFAELSSAGFTADGCDQFVRDYLNQPAWTEPLHMLAETLARAPEKGKVEDREQDAASVLVDMALTVDPVLAASVTRVLGVRSDEPAGERLQQRLREWHRSSDEHHRNCAVAAMLASGLDVFRDIVEPLLSTDDHQTRLRTYRLWPDFRTSTLGSNWPEVVRKWSEGARSDFVSEILHHRLVAEVSAFALADHSDRVKEGAIDAMGWIGAEDEFTHALNTLQDSAFAHAIIGTSPDSIPAALHRRVRRVLRQFLSDVTDIGLRFRVLLLLQKVGDTEAIVDLKAALDKIPADTFRQLNEHVVDAALKVLREVDTDWTSEWIAGRIADGTLWSGRWSVYLAAVPNHIREEQFHRLATENLERSRLEGPILTVVKGADVDIARRAFLRLLDVQKVIDSSPDSPPVLEVEVFRQLTDLLRALAPDLLVAGVSDWLSRDPDRDFLDAFVHLHGRTARMNTEEPILSDRSRELVRLYLKRSLNLILVEEDFDGGLKAAFASLLAQVGERKDADDLLVLVHADIARVRFGRAARQRGERTKAAEHSVMSYTLSYVRSIVRLLGADADQVLLDLLEQPEYEASVVEEFGRVFDLPKWRRAGRRPPYEHIWDARAGGRREPIDRGRRARVAEAIRARIAKLEESRSTEAKPEYLNPRIKKLALGLSQTQPVRYADEILDMISLPAEYDAYLRVETLERLLFAGAALPAERCLPLLDSPLAAMKKWGIQDQDRWVIIRFLCICPYVDPPAAGIEKIRAVTALTHLRSYDVRDLLSSLGHSRFDGALDLMRELVPTVDEWRAIQAEWIDALATLETENGYQAVLGFVDPHLPGLPFTLDWAASDRVAARIARLAARDPRVDARLRELSLLPLDEPRRQLLAKALVRRGKPDAMLPLLNLLDDSGQPRIPWELRQSLEQTFVQREPHPDYPGAFALKPSASNELRAKLFEMVFHDERRKRSAYSLLGQIEEWRLEYGRPVDEPRHPNLASGWPWPPPEPQMSA